MPNPCYTYHIPQTNHIYPIYMCSLSQGGVVDVVEEITVVDSKHRHHAFLFTPINVGSVQITIHAQHDDYAIHTRFTLVVSDESKIIRVDALPSQMQKIKSLMHVSWTCMNCNTENVDNYCIHCASLRP